MIRKDFCGRYTSSSSGTEAEVHAKFVELRYIDTGRTINSTVTATNSKNGHRSGARLCWNHFPKKIDFTVFEPFGQEEEQTAMEWPDPRVGKLAMVEKYTDTDDNTTFVMFVLAAIFICLILFYK